jgi:hypothetical protein
MFVDRLERKFLDQHRERVERHRLRNGELQCGRKLVHFFPQRYADDCRADIHGDPGRHFVQLRRRTDDGGSDIGHGYRHGLSHGCSRLRVDGVKFGLVDDHHQWLHGFRSWNGELLVRRQSDDADSVGRPDGCR